MKPSHKLTIMLTSGHSFHVDVIVEKDNTLTFYDEKYPHGITYPSKNGLKGSIENWLSNNNSCMGYVIDGRDTTKTIPSFINLRLVAAIYVDKNGASQ